MENGLLFLCIVVFLGGCLTVLNYFIYKRKQRYVDKMYAKTSSALVKWAELLAEENSKKWIVIVDVGKAIAVKEFFASVYVYTNQYLFGDYEGRTIDDIVKYLREKDGLSEKQIKNAVAYMEHRKDAILKELEERDVYENQVLKQAGMVTEDILESTVVHEGNKQCNWSCEDTLKRIESLKNREGRFETSYPESLLKQNTDDIKNIETEWINLTFYSDEALTDNETCDEVTFNYFDCPVCKRKHIKISISDDYIWNVVNHIGCLFNCEGNGCKTIFRCEFIPENKYKIEDYKWSVVGYSNVSKKGSKNEVKGQ